MTKWQKSNSRSSKVSVYDVITDRIIDQLKKGVVPWKKPWHDGLPINYITRKPYSGINLLTLPRGGEYMTYNQAQKLGGHVKKGVHGFPIVFFKISEVKPEKEDGIDGKKRIPLIKYKIVFHIDDIENIPSKLKKIEHKPIEEAETIVNNYTEVDIRHDNNKRAFYSLTHDFINIPEARCFSRIEEFYCTGFHEMVHSTGAKHRLNRFGNDPDAGIFGSESYSEEELRAEIGAAMLCGHCGFENVTIDNSAAYIQSWISRLENDHKLIVQAASKAKAAVNFILKVDPSKEEGE